MFSLFFICRSSPIDISGGVYGAGGGAAFFLETRSPWGILMLVLGHAERASRTASQKSACTRGGGVN